MKGALALGTLLVIVGCGSGKKVAQETPGPPSYFTDGGSLGVDDQGAAAEGGAASDPGLLPPRGREPLGAPCNGRAEFCSLRYDQFSQLATHDSAATSSKRWAAPTQDQSVLLQLQNGIRTLMLSLATPDGIVSACRGACEEGSTPLGAVLADVKAFMDVNPRDVVTLLVDSELDADVLAAAFEKAELDSLAYSWSPGESWPTLDDLIAQSARLLVIARTTGAGPAWLLPRDELVLETGQGFTALRDMSCAAILGDAAMPLLLLHHSLVELADGATSDDPGRPSAALAADVNAFDVATQRAQSCARELEHVPNFLAVDFYELGDPAGATQVVNGVRAAPTEP